MASMRRKTIVRYIGPDGRRCAPTTPGARKVSSLSTKWYGFTPAHKTGVPLDASRERAERMFAKILEAAAEGERKYLPGDRVRLESGGPEMTVLDVGRYTGCVVCEWPTADGATHRVAFPPASLTASERKAT